MTEAMNQLFLKNSDLKKNSKNNTIFKFSNCFLMK